METKPESVPLHWVVCFGDESVGKLLPWCSDCGPGAVQEQYKSRLFSLLPHSLHSPPSPWEQGAAPAPDMSCYTPCRPCQPCGPTPLANSCNEPCVRQCQDSTVAIQPSPVNTAVGSSTSAAVGSILSSQGVPINSGGFGLSGLGSGLCGRTCFPC
ncbi:feather keratin 1-like isoform X3 [Manacus candei]|uniref:feather keratin 1-like isoform X3 n=1 Tax=Manacus candei TaxID=415023 RepID=UPI002226A281|nr:feather keratin 1-like isoform X3 [Manacus candei]